MNQPLISRRALLAGAAAGGLGAWRLAAQEPQTTQEVAWLEEIQQPPARRPPETPRLAPLLQNPDGSRITTLPAWRERREELRRWWREFLGDLGVDRSRPPAFKVIAEDRPEGVVRQLIEYQTEPGVTVQAYLLKPAQVAGRRPGVVVLHSTVSHTIRQPAGLEGTPEKAFGLKLAKHGVVCVCPRCFLWTEDLSIKYDDHVQKFRQRHPNCRGMAKMLHDAQVAVDLLQSVPEVDPKQLGAVGHSLGAKEALYLAAFDERIRTAVSSEGGVGTRLSNWEAPWYLGEAIRAPNFTHEHHELLALAAPRAFLLIGGDSADGVQSWPFIEAALPVYRLYANSPRLGLYNHKQGHEVPPESERRIEEWLLAYLSGDKAATG